MRLMKEIELTKEQLYCPYCKSHDIQEGMGITTTMGGMAEDENGNYVTYDPNGASIEAKCNSCGKDFGYGRTGEFRDYKQVYIYSLPYKVED